ncbi:MAG: hypothetical protein R2849_15895 [Thermomicrobiales bacterium]
MPERWTDEERITSELRRRRLTFAQRRKHLDRLERAIAAGEDEMEFLKRRSRTEVGVLVATVALMFFGFLFWTTVLGESESSDDSSNLVALAEATLTAREAMVEPTATTVPVIVPTSTSLVASSPGACPVDPLATELIPALPLGDPAHGKWYGSLESELWVSPADLSVVFPSGMATPDTLWFAGQMTQVMWYGTSQGIAVTGEQLDGNATLGPVESSEPMNQVQWTGFTIPEPGCWRLTGRTSETELTLTVNVLPGDARPDIAMIREYYEARPYEAPSTCAITPWSGPESRGNSEYAHYWLEDDGISAEVPGLFIANQQQSMGIYGTDVVDAVSVTASNLDSDSGEVVRASTSIWDSNARLASFVFTSPGCWELKMETSTSSATFTVYVYPAACEPVFEDGEYLVSCEPPTS